MMNTCAGGYAAATTIPAIDQRSTNGDRAVGRVTIATRNAHLREARRTGIRDVRTPLR